MSEELQIGSAFVCTVSLQSHGKQMRPLQGALAGNEASLCLLLLQRKQIILIIYLCCLEKAVFREQRGVSLGPLILLLTMVGQATVIAFIFAIIISSGITEKHVSESVYIKV